MTIRYRSIIEVRFVYPVSASTGRAYVSKVGETSGRTCLGRSDCLSGSRVGERRARLPAPCSGFRRSRTGDAEPHDVGHPGKGHASRADRAPRPSRQGIPVPAARPEAARQAGSGVPGAEGRDSRARLFLARPWLPPVQVVGFAGRVLEGEDFGEPREGRRESRAPQGCRVARSRDPGMRAQGG